MNWEIWNLLPHVLPLMVNLKKLRFSEVRRDKSAHWILARPSFQLEELHWGCEWEGDEMVEFLATQPELRVLSLRYDLHCPIPSSILPRLASVKANNRALMQLLPGRPNISEVFWINRAFPSPLGEDVLVGEPELPSELLSQMGKIRFLSLEEYGRPRPKLSMLSGRLPSLIVLETDTIYQVGTHDSQRLLSLTHCAYRRNSRNSLTLRASNDWFCRTNSEWTIPGSQAPVL